MKILKVKQIQEWDKFTMQSEPIASIDLMERASKIFTRWIKEKLKDTDQKILVVVSKGNNGGDGLAVARMLDEAAYDLEVLICNIQKEASQDFTTNLERLRFKNVPVKSINPGDKIPDLNSYTFIIDGIFGSGLTRPVEGYWQDLIEVVNKSCAKVYSIDIPSGMFGDRPTPSYATVISADFCLSFERPKLSFFYPSNGKHLKSWTFSSIGLDPSYLKDINSDYHLIEAGIVKKALKTRGKFDHKGSFGKTLIAAGQKGMIGAAVLAVGAALKSGTGLVYCLLPEQGINIMQISHPEAIVIHGYGENNLSETPELEAYTGIGIGPGLGVNDSTKTFLESFLRKANRPIVLDADALNILAQNKELLDIVPKNSILTPHPGEFERLFGPSTDDLSRIELLIEQAIKHNIYIVLKGAHTTIASPQGSIYFNNTGNPGMASGGSGDVLTGLISALLSQGYSSLNASISGVYLHGLAGDIAVGIQGEEAMTASDLTNHIGSAFQKIKDD